MKFTDLFDSAPVLLDGAMGSILQKNGLAPGEPPEPKCITDPELIEQVHYQYVTAGARIILTNTFGASSLKMSDSELSATVTAAVACARRAIDRSGRDDVLVALDVGPTGRMLKPLGDLDFEDAVNILKKTVALGAAAGCDLILIETMGDIYEAKAALIAAKEACNLPVAVSCAFGSDGRLFTGATPEVVGTVLSSLGADMIGANCSVGPRELLPVIKRLVASSSVPVFAKPNAGLPTLVDGQTTYSVTPNEFAESVRELVRAGAVAVGGCCGTSPEYISALKTALAGVIPTPVSRKTTAVASYSTVVEIGKHPVLIGERINPTGKPRLKEALRASDLGYILREAVSEEEDGAHILDVNVGLPEIDEPKMLRAAVKEIQSVTVLPLSIDTASPTAMESALRVYNGKPLINSVNGKRESLDAILPLAKKYGGVLICLTLDENGIPKTAEERLEIAERIISAAKEQGIPESELVFDPLCLSIGADHTAARELVRTLRLFEARGLMTSLGISNVSFGLPDRERLNSTFLSMAFTAGLDCAIVNPHSRELMEVYHAYLALSGLDEGCREYVEYAGGNPQSTPPVLNNNDITLAYAIKKGMRDRAAELTRDALKSTDPMKVIDGGIIPALNEVGEAYERGESYLPTLLMSAEAAASAFEVIKERLPASATDKCTIVLATVEGDIHDIGKNIVRLLLENYGFRVIDLGRDVAPEAVLAAAREHNARLVGLSALMTTTLPAMERTVRLLREKLPGVRVIVGGAVLTAEYADRIGADAYSPDAMGAVRYAESVAVEG